MQPIAEIEKAYETPDPWNFKTTPDDLLRKIEILNACKSQREHYDSALEIGAGEGFITIDLPASQLHGFEVSHLARSRMPKNIIPRDSIEKDEKFDLVVVPGVLYAHYDCGKFFEIIDQNANDVVVTSSIKNWEVKCMGDWQWLNTHLRMREIYSKEFPYREFVQKLRVFKKI